MLLGRGELVLRVINESLLLLSSCLVLAAATAFVTANFAFSIPSDFAAVAAAASFLLSSFNFASRSVASFNELTASRLYRDSVPSALQL